MGRYKVGMGRYDGWWDVGATTRRKQLNAAGDQSHVCLGSSLLLGCIKAAKWIEEPY